MIVITNWNNMQTLWIHYPYPSNLVKEKYYPLHIYDINFIYFLRKSLDSKFNMISTLQLKGEEKLR